MIQKDSLLVDIKFVFWVFFLAIIIKAFIYQYYYYLVKVHLKNEKDLEVSYIIYISIT